MTRLLLLMTTHGIALALGFGLGVYLLPILTAPEGPDREALESSAAAAVYTAEFTRDLRGSDFLHWGEGSVSITPTQVVHMGALAPGPDYKLYLLPDFAAHEDEFLPQMDAGVVIADIKTFDGFIADIPEGVDIEAYTTVAVWCESFSEFITAARYR